MKRSVLSFFLALCLSLLPVPALAAGGTTNFTNSETHFRTSYREDEYLDFTISGNTLTVSGKLQNDGLKKVQVKLSAPLDWDLLEPHYDENGEEYYIAPEDPYADCQYIQAASGKAFSTDLKLAFSGKEYAVDVNYTCDDEPTFEQMSRAAETGEEIVVTYRGISHHRLFIIKANSGYRFKQSLILDNNLAFVQATVNPDDFRQPVSDAIRSLSNQIVGTEKDDYNKLFLLHKWVAENIYYDFDYLIHNSGDIHYSAEDVITYKRTVCEGYARLLNALIRAQGIPSMFCTTKALGLNTSGGSFALKTDYNTSGDDANHAHVEAWADGRWVVMDPTWDSNNRYEYGRFESSAPDMYLYFDITPEVFALDHWYISRADGQITMQDGKIVNKTADKSAEQPTRLVTTVTATPTKSSVLVNGKAVRFDAYNINGNNFFKLRDLAQVLRGSEKQFEVTWDGKKNAINLISGASYTSVGGELTQGDGATKTATLTASTIFKDGTEIKLTAYNINGNNYFKLRDLGIAFDFDVSWDGSRNTITVETAKSYTAD